MYARVMSQDCMRIFLLGAQNPEELWMAESRMLYVRFFLVLKLSIVPARISVQWISDRRLRNFCQSASVATSLSKSSHASGITIFPPRIGLCPPSIMIANGKAHLITSSKEIFQPVKLHGLWRFYLHTRLTILTLSKINLVRCSCWFRLVRERN